MTLVSISSLHEYLDGKWLENRPRPLTDGAEAMFVEVLAVVVPFPVWTSRSALAPKLNRRAKAEGEEGEELGSASPSSIALSLTDVEGELLPPKLVCLFLIFAKGEVWVGEPAIVKDAMDVRRRC